MSSNECRSCGKKWEDHKGVVWTCEELHKLRKLTNEMCSALLLPGMTTLERHLRMGLIVSDIRALDPEVFDKEVAQPCGLLF